MKEIDINKFNTLKDVEEYRRKINEACDKRSSFIVQCTKASGLSERPFITLKKTFENMAPVLFESVEGKALMNKYTSTIRSSKNLKSLHTLAENIRKANKSIDTDYFVNNITNVNWNVDNTTLSEDLKKLGRVVTEAYLFIGEDADKYVSNDENDLSRAVEYISENNKSNKNIVEYSEAVKIIKESINSQDGERPLYKDNLNNIATELIEGFNNKYEGELSDNEKELVKEVASTSKYEVFEKYKSTCLNKINEAKECNDAETINRLNSIFEQVSRKTYSDTTFLDDIFSLYEMINVLN